MSAEEKLESDTVSIQETNANTIRIIQYEKWRQKNLLGLKFYGWGKYRRANNLHKQNFQMARSILMDKMVMAFSLEHIIICHIQLKNYNLALKCSENLLNICHSLGNDELKRVSLFHIQDICAGIYEKSKNCETTYCIEIITKLLTNCLKERLESWIYLWPCCQTFDELSLMYDRVAKNQDIIFIYQRELEKSILVNSLNWQMKCRIKIANAYYELQKWHESIIEYTSAYNLTHRCSKRIARSSVAFKLHCAYLQIEDNEKAIQFLRIYLNYNEKLGNDLNREKALVGLIELMYLTGCYYEAKKYAIQFRNFGIVMKKPSIVKKCVEILQDIETRIFTQLNNEQREPIITTYSVIDLHPTDSLEFLNNYWNNRIELAKDFQLDRNYSRSLEIFLECFKIANEVLLDKTAIHQSSYYLGMTYRFIHKYNEARIHLDLALKIAQDSNNTTFKELCYFEIGEILIKRVMYESNPYEIQTNSEIKSQLLEAIDYFMKSLNIQIICHKMKLSLERLGDIYCMLGLYIPAIYFYSAKLNEGEILKNKLWQIEAHQDIANVQMCISNFSASIDQFNIAIRLAREIKNSNVEAKLHFELATCYFMCGRPNQSIDCYQKYLTVFEGIHDPKRHAIAYFILSYIYLNLNQLQLAIQYSEKHLSIARMINEISEIQAAEQNIQNLRAKLNEDGVLIP